MALEDKDPFGEYVPEPQTAGTLPAGQAAEPDEVESAKYGIGVEGSRGVI